VDLRSRRRIESDEYSVQIRRTKLCRPLSQSFSQLFPALRPWKQAFQERTKIQPSAADHDRQSAALDDRIDRGSRLPSILARSERLIGFGDVEQVVRNERLFGARGLGSTDLEAAIDGHRIAADYLACEALRQVERQCRLSRRRWPQNDRQQWLRLRR
jgi:hypothetical protein